jgi:hypothetical protein
MLLIYYYDHEEDCVVLLNLLRYLVVRRDCCSIDHAIDIAPFQVSADQQAATFSRDHSQAILNARMDVYKKLYFSAYVLAPMIV